MLWQLKPIKKRIRMKKNIIIFIWNFLLFSSMVFSQTEPILDEPKVDQNVELLSIVFRLAECKEYSSVRFKLYTDKIENHFLQYKDHELIKCVKEKRNESGIGYDAVMLMAVHIGNAPDFKPLVNFSNKIPDVRWGKKNADQFLVLLRKFYQDANCESFFKSNEQLYWEVSKRFSSVSKSLDMKWFQEFYGEKPRDDFFIINGLANGGGNYGPHLLLKKNKRNLFAVMGTWLVDSEGMPAFPMKDYFPILVHEFNHSFVNKLTEKHSNRLRKSGEKMYKEVSEKMMKQAYTNWKTMMDEALVRASVIKYMKEHGFDKQEIDNEIQLQESKGFFWIQNLVNELDRYQRQRDTYKTLDEFMIVIADFYIELIENNNFKK